uniref:WW domain-containing protein n=1 Tax=Guillardia theta (strain CCMP2712) TaxID=905079 RepID=A0A0C3U4P7_GUITC
MVIEYAKYLGVDPLREPQLLRIAQEGLVAPLPDGWSEHTNDHGEVFYHHRESGSSVWQHPLDNFYKSKVRTKHLSLLCE